MVMKTLKTPQGRQLAYRYTPPVPGPASGPTSARTFVWLCGFKSDMSGTKVTVLEDWAKTEGHGFLAFDYSGHGRSDGAFEDGTISAWREDALAVIEALGAGELVLVGSSMGAWIALLAALALGGKVKAMVLIAPAPDFTQKLIWPQFDAPAQAEIMTDGRTLRPSDYGEPYPITRALIVDGQHWTLLDGPIAFDGPVRILQGMQDTDVPWQHAVQLAEALTSPDTVLSLIKDGDHRLSRDQDIARLLNLCSEMAG